MNEGTIDPKRMRKVLNYIDRKRNKISDFPREPLSYVIHKIVAQGLLYVCTMAGFKKYCPETLWNFHLAALVVLPFELHNLNFNFSSNMLKNKWFYYLDDI